MLAVEAPADVKFPLLASAKLDGFRGVVENGKILSRTGKPIPNLFVQKYFKAHPELDGLDGELIVGDPNAKDVFRKTSSGVMSVKGEPEFHYYVFDYVKTPNLPYSQRQAIIAKINLPERVLVLHQVVVNNRAELDAYEEKCVVQLGYEGLIVRRADAPYKHGRSTANEAYLLKVRRFVDSEAVIIGFKEEQSNQNIATLDNFGHTERSSHKAGKVPKGSLGAFLGKDIHNGMDANVGTGYSLKEREEFWNNQEKYRGKIMKYRYFEVGMKDKPRFGSFQGFRDKIDM